MRVGYVRMYSDREGESHFEDLSVELVETDFAPPTGPVDVAPFLASSRTMLFAAHPGWAGEIPHPAPQRQLFIFLRGATEVTVSDGERRPFGPGDLLLLDDIEGRGHSTHVVGGEDLVVVIAVLADQEPHPGPSRGAAAATHPGDGRPAPRRR